MLIGSFNCYHSLHLHFPLNSAPKIHCRFRSNGKEGGFAFHFILPSSPVETKAKNEDR